MTRHIGAARRILDGVDLLIGAVRALLEGRSFQSDEPVETRRELSGRYLRELQELVDHGELGLAAAERIRSNLFERAPDGERFKLPTCQAYLKELTGSIGPHVVCSAANAPGPRGDDEMAGG